MPQAQDQPHPHIASAQKIVDAALALYAMSPADIARSPQLVHEHARRIAGGALELRVRVERDQLARDREHAPARDGGPGLGR